MQLDFPSGDVTVIQLTGIWGKLTIFNIYNDGNHNDTINALTKFQRDNADLLGNIEQGVAHMIWLGDFNRHHPQWDNHDDDRLFTNEALGASEILIEALAEAGLELALPSGIPTHVHNVTKKWTRLDQVFITDHSMDLISMCDTVTASRGVNTDHLPILTKIDLEAAITEERETHNFRDVDWDLFNKELESKLSELEPAAVIETQHQLNDVCDSLTSAIQNTIKKVVPISRINAKTKRWWTKELTTLRKQADKLGRNSSKLSHIPNHTIHDEHTAAVKLYRTTLERTKQQHWRDWLERAVDPDIWVVNKLINSQVSDGGKSKIPTLTHTVNNVETKATSNEEKSNALAKCFFPIKPPIPEDENLLAPKPCCKAAIITEEHIKRQLRRIKPYKAPGPDGIPNIVLTKCADMLTPRLLAIYTAIYNKTMHYNPWKHFTTVVLRKPGKPRYDIPKAYRPIALLNTMWKVLTGIVAEHLTFYTEKYNLLPDHHYGGRPSRTTTDALHMLTYRIKDAWRKGKVASVLFLDIEGAFPNAVPEKLIRNLRQRGVPKRIVEFTANMLVSRETLLKFDDYISEAIPINNGIGQGDPLSMGLYQFYNAGLLDIPSEQNQLAIAYVDDALLFASGDSFEETHDTLIDLMSKEGGVADWSRDHNSPLEYSKLALIDFSHQNRDIIRPNLVLPHGTVKPERSVKYLGVIIDQHLSWTPQHANAIKKGTTWTSQIKRIAKPSWGVTPKYARRLYIGVALPRILYGAEVWYTPAPVGKWKKGSKKQLGTIGVTKKLASTQRTGAIAVTGGLRTSPSDTLDALAYLLPFDLTINSWCFRAALRISTLTEQHPLRKPMRACAKRTVIKHKSPLHTLLRTLNTDPCNTEIIPPKIYDPSKRTKPPFKVRIAASKEDSKKEAQEATEEIQVYTDGSVIDSKVGAAAILTRPGKDHRILRYHLGSESQHTTYDAELVGLSMGMYLIKTEKLARRSTMLGVDCQAAINALQNELSTHSLTIAADTLRTATQISKERGDKNYSLTIRWTAGHVGIDGNEIVDKEAKKAAKGQSSEPSSLPRILRRKLKASSAALKQERNKTDKENWKKRWTNSHRGRKDSRIDSSSPSKHFLNLISAPKLSRQAASLIAQLRISHAPLNGYLYRFKRVDNPRCPACGETEETVEHFLLHCPTYAHERWALEKSIKCKPNLKTLLGDRKATLPLKNYIHATHRFDMPKANES